MALFISLALPATAEPILVSAVGDIMLGTNYPRNLLPADQGRSLLREAAPYLKAADVRFGNFEDTFFDGDPQPDGKTPGPNRWLFRTPIDYVERLVEAGFNVMSLANNHARDFGRAGIESSKVVLKLAHIQYSSKDGEVAHLNVRGTPIALIAADYYRGGRSIVTPDSTYREIESLSRQGQIVFVSVHAGGEGEAAETVPAGVEMYLGENRGDSVAFARKAIDLGADLVIMHGPHVVRGMEIHRGRLIIYSLGNFATAAGIGVGGLAGLAPLAQVRVSDRGEFLSGRIVSFRQIRERGTVLDPSHAAFLRMKMLSEKDFPQSSPKFSSDGNFKIQ